MIFNTLLKVAINNKVKVTINYIHEQTKITRATISSTLAFLNERGFIMVEKQKGNRFTGCDIVPSKLNEILMHYQIKNN
jgi:predicted transcriptional regulator